MVVKTEIASLKDRQLRQLRQYFRHQVTEHGYQFFLGASDIGVRKNLGRNGARFAPAVLMNHLGKMNCHREVKMGIQTLANQHSEQMNYHKARQNSAHLLAESLREQTSFIHLGGGHDHIYYLLKGIEQKWNKPLVVVNIDAHCDTRIDSLPHSGTPFIDFYRETKNPFKLIQYGIHQYANSTSTLTAIKKEDMPIISLDEIDLYAKVDKQLALIEQHITQEQDYLLVLSLDSDALACDQMESVSAVNPHGLPLNHVVQIIKALKNRHRRHLIGLGIYEYNPLFDNLSAKGAKSLAYLIYQFMELGSP